MSLSSTKYSIILLVNHFQSSVCVCPRKLISPFQVDIFKNIRNAYKFIEVNIQESFASLKHHHKQWSRILMQLCRNIFTLQVRGNFVYRNWALFRFWSLTWAQGSLVHCLVVMRPISPRLYMSQVML